MSRVPRNIQKSLEQQQAIDKATAYAVSLRQGNSKAEWFENDFKRMETIAASGPLKASVRVDTKQELRDAGMRSGIEAIKLKRQARLKELMEAEQLQHEQELNSMGMSLVKPVD